MMRRLSAFLLAMSVAGSARAAGIEDTVQGTLALGRAAVVGRSDDFLATWLNPANLAGRDERQLGLELRLTHFAACYDRAYDPSASYRRPGALPGFLGTESVAEVCNRGPLGPGLNLGWAQRFTRWGWGLGVFTPAAGAGHTRWGNATVVTVEPREDERYPPTLRGVEAPSRQMGIERTGMGAYLAAGLAWAPLPQLRLGVSVGVGMLRIAYSSVASTQGGSFLDQEILQALTVSDYAIPRTNVGVVVTPVAGFELFGTFVYQGDFDGRGHMDLTANGFREAPLRSCRDDPPGPRCRIEGIRLRAPFPRFEATAGMRVVGKHGDLELDLNWAQTSHVDAYRTTLYRDRPPRVQLSSADDSQVEAYAPGQRYAVPKRWRDTWTLRAGGDWNVLRDRLTLRAGISLASAAVATPYMSIDAWPVRKLGLHGGLTLRLGDYRLSLAYARLLYDAVSVRVGEGRVREVVGRLAERANAVNEGDYRAHADVLSVQLDVRF